MKRYGRFAGALSGVLVLAIGACASNAELGQDEEDTKRDPSLDVAFANELQWVDKTHSLVAGPAAESCRYTPPDLISVSTVGGRDGAAYKIRAMVQPHLEALISAAREATGQSLRIHSGYRSFDSQVGAYARWRDECVSAYPGHSEHQLGTTVDLKVEGYDPFVCNGGFASMRVYPWLMDHAHEFGFSLSYPSCNVAGYRAEAWHFRYVGEEIATAVHAARIGELRERADAGLDPDDDTAAAPARADAGPLAPMPGISVGDFFRCYGASLPFVYGESSGPAERADGVPSLCTAEGAGPRFAKVGQICDRYCASDPTCEARDQDAVCARLSVSIDALAEEAKSRYGSEDGGSADAGRTDSGTDGGIAPDGGDARFTCGGDCPTRCFVTPEGAASSRPNAGCCAREGFSFSGKDHGDGTVSCWTCAESETGYATNWVGGEHVERQACERRGLD